MKSLKGRRRSQSSSSSTSIAVVGCVFLSIYIFYTVIVLLLVPVDVDVDIRIKDAIHEHEDGHYSDTNINTYMSRRNSMNKGELAKPKSLSILQAEVQNINRPNANPDEEFDLSVEKDRCDQFKGNLVYNGGDKRRRIFAGGLLADDSWHVLGASALETFGIFHSFSFIESNRTQSFEPRALRFTSGSEELKLLQSGIYGPSTTVYVENFVYEKRILPIIREHMMRERILEKWKELGMTREDIGIIIDVDEIPSRDFLRAIQVCDPPDGSWSSTSNQTCRAPLIRMSLPMFEGSPKCIHKGIKNLAFKRFTTPSVVIGACIEGIGDFKVHPPVPREKYIDGKAIGGRVDGYGMNFDYSQIPNGENGYYPLYNGADFRKMKSGHMFFGGVGFHLHNFFDSADKIRFKYRYYGHIHDHAFEVPLGALNADMNLFVKCAHNISDAGNRKERLQNGLDLLSQSYKLPVAFEIDGYVDARHAEMKILVENDEEEFGRADKFDGNHLYNSEMLTKPGRKNKMVGQT